MEAGAANATMQYSKFNNAIQPIQHCNTRNTTSGMHTSRNVCGSNRSVTAKLTSQVSRNKIGPADFVRWAYASVVVLIVFGRTDIVITLLSVERRDIKPSFGQFG